MTNADFFLILCAVYLAPHVSERWGQALSVFYLLLALASLDWSSP